MKKIMMATALAIGMMSCGDQSTEAEMTSDSTNMTDANAAPMGDTTGMISSEAGNYPTDTSNRNGDDSVSGSNPSSRTSTPGNQNGNNGPHGRGNSGAGGRNNNSGGQ